MFKRFWWVLLIGLVVGPVVGAALGGLAAYVLPKEYEAMAAVQPRMTSRADFDQVEHAFIKAPGTLDRVVADLGLDRRWAMSAKEARQRLASLIELQNSRGTDLIEIRARSTDPAEAAEITNSVTAAYVSRRTELSRPTGETGPTVTVHADAVETAAPVSPNVPLLLLLGSAAGLLLGILASLFLIPFLHRTFPARQTALA